MNKYEQAISGIIKRMETELATTLYYHGLYHTKDVMEVSKSIGEIKNISREEMNLLLVAAAFHDSGHLVTYSNHEEAGCGIAYIRLSELGFSMEEIKTVCKLIMATKVPQKPETNLERILCDADLDYLGRDDYDEISGWLYKEFCEWGILCGEKKWTETQISFLSAHKFWTEASLQNREPKKRSKIKFLEEKLKTL